METIAFIRLNGPLEYSLIFIFKKGSNMKLIKNSNINHREIETALESEVFFNREYTKNHQRYADELKFLNLIKEGQLDTIKANMDYFSKHKVGRMSKNPLRQDIYEFVAITTLVTRFAMEGGMEEEEAYHLSDIYIQKADACNSSSYLWDLYTHMILDFTQRVHDRKKVPETSASVQLVLDYIYSHLHYDISLKELALQAGLTETYLCYLFKKEIGDTITEFIHKKRVAEAQSLLLYSEYTIGEISQYLGFCSQSHFTFIFKKYANTTPSQFRKKFYRKNWTM
jgi:AraC-like DNA-binding protein